MNLEQAIERFKDYKAVGRSMATVKTYGTGLNRFLAFRGNVPVQDLTTEDLPGFIGHLRQEGLARGTISNYVTAATEFYKWLMRKRHTSIEPGEYLLLQEELEDLRKGIAPERKEPKLPSEGAVEGALLSASLTDDDGERLHLMWLRNRALIGILESSGCRVGEAAALKRANLVEADRSATVIGKGNKTRTLYFSKAAWANIQEYLQARDEAHLQLRDAQEPVLARHDPPGHAQRMLSGMTTNALRDALKRICRTAGVKYFKPHSLRHRKITEVVEATGNMELARAVAGHASIITTQIYAHMKREDVRAAARATMKGE